MTRRHHFAFPFRRAAFEAALGAALCLPLAAAAQSAAQTWPVTPAQKGTAQQVAQAGVPLSELAPNAPDSHTVVPGDTLWDISKIFLKSPWRWPELWGMNLDQIRNPHLIFPGQVLVLEKSGGRARLTVAKSLGGGAETTVRLSPRVRSSALTEPLASVPLNLIEPFLNEAVVFETDELAGAPRIVATPEGSVLLSRGDRAYVRGDLGKQREFRMFREARPMTDPTTGEVLGFEASFVGTAEYVLEGGTLAAPDGKVDIVPATFIVTGVRKEAGVGDRLSPVPPRDFVSYVPHAPGAAIAGQIVSIYGEGLSAGQNQIVLLNRGRDDGMDPGTVLALWSNGRTVVDRTSGDRAILKLPDEREGRLFVFRSFKRMSYALILSSSNPVRRGDRFTQP
ncbi:MAG: LysM peptidoglycan-binding domain-containing protein [Piscinibacter sp.]|nr:LysM peptidoglycan-binding domain-containing protein [Piscinibacter sp.]